MTRVRIVGPARIADAAGTHDPGEIINLASEALVNLAKAGTKNPETKQPYVEIVEDTPPPAPAPPQEPAEAAPAEVVQVSATDGSNAGEKA